MKELFRKIYFLAPFLAAAVIIIVLYFMRYDTLGTEEDLVRAASEYTESDLEAVMMQEIPGTDGICDGKGGLILLCRSADDGSGTEAGSARWNGVIRFERGINGRYVPVESNLYDYSVPVHSDSMNDGSMGIFGGDDGSGAVTVFFSCNYPEDMARVEITCYDREAYMEDGSIVPYIVTIETDGTPYMEIVPVSFHLYDREYRIYDREGNLKDRSDPVYEAAWSAAYAGNSEGRGSADGSSESYDMYGLILLAGAGLSWWLLRRRNLKKDQIG